MRTSRRVALLLERLRSALQKLAAHCIYAKMCLRQQHVDGQWFRPERKKNRCRHSAKWELGALARGDDRMGVSWATGGPRAGGAESMLARVLGGSDDGCFCLVGVKESGSTSNAAPGVCTPSKRARCAYNHGHFHGERPFVRWHRPGCRGARGRWQQRRKAGNVVGIADGGDWLKMARLRLLRSWIGNEIRAEQPCTSCRIWGAPKMHA